MGVYYDVDKLPTFANVVLTVGTYDGVHLGHKAILAKVVETAQAINGNSIVITFHPHPRKLLYPQQSLGLITPLEDKIKYLTQAGIAHVVVVPFTEAFAQLSALEYIEQFIVKKFNPKCFVIGYDHRFGNDRKGNFQLLEAQAAHWGYNVVEISAKLIDDASISSTRIRQALISGDMPLAQSMLGREFSLKGTVIKGKQIGRTIGFPTANIQPHDADQIIPATGIYVLKAEFEGQELRGVLSIGYNPTVSADNKLHIEAYFFDFNQDIYNKEIILMPLHYLRQELNLPNLDVLQKQIQEDCRQAALFFERLATH
ncbi:MAG: riboflavin biosynthesis protein RibF [Chitinophagia bacterium]|nr:riboflavin biosynthesis protein RibF [Chitinophagia bacterium]